MKLSFIFNSKQATCSAGQERMLSKPALCPLAQHWKTLLLIVMKSPESPRHCIEQASSLWFQTLPNHRKSQTPAILSVP